MFYYIEYTLHFDDDYNEIESAVIEAKDKKHAKVILKNRLISDNYKRLEIGTIYQTTNDARSS